MTSSRKCRTDSMKSCSPSGNRPDNAASRWAVMTSSSAVKERPRCANTSSKSTRRTVMARSGSLVCVGEMLRSTMFVSEYRSGFEVTGEVASRWATTRTAVAMRKRCRRMQSPGFKQCGHCRDPKAGEFKGDVTTRTCSERAPLDLATVGTETGEGTEKGAVQGVSGVKRFRLTARFGANRSTSSVGRSERPTATRPAPPARSMPIDSGKLKNRRSTASYASAR